MYWLVKSEPEEYSFSDLMRDGRAVWEGVRNPQAQKYLRQMQVGEEVLYYHTGNTRAIVGIARVARTAFPDPTDTRYMAVELEGVRWLGRPILLAEIKADSFFKDFALVRQSRLSVMPVPPEVWEKILEKVPF
ncbi:MAG: EVE domain-containing protein [Bacteroidia bacterium]|jgi:predicted RNA-binding protein with PUA-like domain|nr:EVE domain-containing protein [Bacteroidia bacterium]